nr:hypothetical protein [Pseudarthrobacter sp. MEB009]
MSEVEAIVVVPLLVDACGKQCESFLASSAERDEFTGVVDPEQGDANDRRNIEHVADTARGASVLDGRKGFPRNASCASEVLGGHPSRNARHPNLLPEHGNRVLGSAG